MFFWLMAMAEESVLAEEKRKSTNGRKQKYWKEMKRICGGSGCRSKLYVSFGTWGVRVVILAANKRRLETPEIQIYFRFYNTYPPSELVPGLFSHFVSASTVSL
jgi:hypothetical protein